MIHAGRKRQPNGPGAHCMIHAGRKRQLNGPGAHFMIHADRKRQPNGPGAHCMIHAGRKRQPNCPGAHCMIHAGRKRQSNGPGSFVGGPLPVSFFLLFSSSPIRASIDWVGVDGFALFSDPFFLRSFRLFSSFDIFALRPRGSRIMYLFNKYINNTYSFQTRNRPFEIGKMSLHRIRNYLKTTSK